MGGEDIKSRCLKFAVGVIKISNKLPKTSAGFEIGKQIVRSASSIGANISEANSSRSKAEFISIMTINN